MVFEAQKWMEMYCEVVNLFTKLGSHSLQVA